MLWGKGWDKCWGQHVGIMPGLLIFSQSSGNLVSSSIDSRGQFYLVGLGDLLIGPRASLEESAGYLRVGSKTSFGGEGDGDEQKVDNPRRIMFEPEDINWTPMSFEDIYQ